MVGAADTCGLAFTGSRALMLAETTVASSPTGVMLYLEALSERRLMKALVGELKRVAAHAHGP